MNTATSEIKLLVPKNKQVLTTIKSSIPINNLSAGKLMKAKQGRMENNKNTRFYAVVILHYCYRIELDFHFQRWKNYLFKIRPLGFEILTIKNHCL